MIYTLDQLREIITPIAEKYDIPAVYIFGSYARGEATEESDVDLLIDRKGSKIRGMFDMGGLYNDLNEELRKELSLVTKESLDESDQRLPRFARNVRNDRRLIYESSRSAAY